MEKETKRNCVLNDRDTWMDKENDGRIQGGTTRRERTGVIF